MRRMEVRNSTIAIEGGLSLRSVAILAIAHATPSPDVTSNPVSQAIGVVPKMVNQTRPNKSPKSPQL